MISGVGEAVTEEGSASGVGMVVGDWFLWLEIGVGSGGVYFGCSGVCFGCDVCFCCTGVVLADDVTGEGAGGSSLSSLPF